MKVITLSMTLDEWERFLGIIRGTTPRSGDVRLTELIHELRTAVDTPPPPSRSVKDREKDKVNA